MTLRFLLSCLTVLAFSSMTVSATPGLKFPPGTEIVPESYISLSPPSKITIDTTGLEKLANQHRPNLMAPVFHVYRTGDRGSPLLRKPYSYYEASFEIERNFPKDAPEIACIITGGGSGFYRETILLYQRKKDDPDGWMQMAKFYLQAPQMPWYLNGASVRRILLTENHLTIMVGESGTPEPKPYGRIKYSFQLEKGIYKSRSILISGMEDEQKDTPFPLKFLNWLAPDFLLE